MLWSDGFSLGLGVFGLSGEEGIALLGSPSGGIPGLDPGKGPAGPRRKCSQSRVLQRRGNSSGCI